MPRFDFNVGKHNYKIRKKSSHNVVIEKGLSGVVCVDYYGNLYIRNDNNQRYDISESSYHCKGKKYVFTVAHPELKFLIVRNNSELNELPFMYYLPFYIGVRVTFDIRIALGKTFAFIRNCYPFLFSNETKSAIRYYKANKERIDKILIQKKINGRL